MGGRGKINEIEKSCSICERSRPLVEEKVYLCEKYGLVKPDAVCGGFVLDTLRITPRLRRMPKESFKKEDFLI